MPNLYSFIYKTLPVIMPLEMDFINKLILANGNQIEIYRTLVLPGNLESYCLSPQAVFVSRPPSLES